MAKYHTEGIVKDVELTQKDGTFKLDPVAPYSVEEKSGDKAEKSILFVDENEVGGKSVFVQKDTEGKTGDINAVFFKMAFLAHPDSSFSFSRNGTPIDTASLLILKQNKSRIRIVVDGDLFKPTVVTGKKFVVSEIIVK